MVKFLIPIEKIGNAQAGFAFKANLFNEIGSGLPIIRVRDVGVSDPKTYFSGEYRSEFLITQGDWLIAMDGDFRVARWAGPTALLNQRVSRLQFYSDEISSKDVFIALQIELRKLQGIKAYTTVDHLSGKQIAASLIRLPPKEEQSRIVTKVDELIALCDKLETQQQQRCKLQNHLTKASLQALAEAKNPEELTKSWLRVTKFGFPLKPGHLTISEGYGLRDLDSFEQVEALPSVQATRKTTPGIRFRISDSLPLSHLHV